MHVGWAEHARALRAAREALHRPRVAAPGADLCVILPSFRRAPNLALSARLALAAPSVREVLVVNDAPEVDVRAHLGLTDRRLRVVDHARRIGPVGRYLAARDADANRFVSLDDDLFLPPDGIERLGAALRAAPDVPHGFYGQRLRADGRFEDNLARFAGRVDVLNRAYAFTRAHVARYLGWLDALGIDLDDAARLIALDDDIVLSFVGEGRPRVHDVGPWIDCPSERRRGLARWRRRDAETVRRALYARLAEASGRDPIRYGPTPRPRGGPRHAGLALLEALSGAALLRRALDAVRSA